MNLFINEVSEENIARNPADCIANCTGTYVGVTCSGSDCLGGCRWDACYNNCVGGCYDQTCQTSCSTFCGEIVFGKAVAM